MTEVNQLPAAGRPRSSGPAATTGSRARAAIRPAAVPAATRDDPIEGKTRLCPPPSP
jgi:hypothetical protein